MAKSAAVEVTVTLRNGTTAVFGLKEKKNSYATALLARHGI